MWQAKSLAYFMGQATKIAPLVPLMPTLSSPLNKALQIRSVENGHSRPPRANPTWMETLRV